MTDLEKEYKDYKNDYCFFIKNHKISSKIFTFENWIEIFSYGFEAGYDAKENNELETKE